MNILAIGCHPDDIEIGCAGTLVKYKKQGHNVMICHVANGDMGHVIIQPQELRAIRKEEAKNAGALAGIEVVTCDIGDLTVYDTKDQRDKIVGIIREVQPDVIITHSPCDYMPDHTAVSKLVFDASFAASVPHYGAGSPANITPIYYMDTLAGLSFVPSEYVDITEEFETKIKMLECHESQMKWMRDHDNIDFADFVKTCAKFRGLQCGAQYAEAFAVCVAWPKVTCKRLLP